MKHSITLLALFLCYLTSYSQDFGGGAKLTHSDNISEAQRQSIQNRLQKNRARLISEGKLNYTKTSQIPLESPVKASSPFEDYNFIAISNYVDHNEETGSLTDYNCGSRSYDTESGYDHRGTDYFSWPFSWNLMDTDMVEIVAAAGGTIIDKADGNDDKSCSFNSNPWNAVYIEHTDGSIAWYGHLKNGSVTSKEIGETVTTGEYLGIMGSSGNSTGPHLHLEIYSDGDLIDPYIGDCNATTSDSWWNNQEDYYAPTINALKTHSAAPQFGCYNEERTNIENEFDLGNTVFFAAYFRDQQIQHVSYHNVYRPDGSLFNSWQTRSNAEHYSASYWYRSFTIPTTDQPGEWRFTVDYLDNQYEHTFCVSPSKPEITVSEDQLISSSEVGNQWYFEGEPIEGANDQIYLPLEDGNYSVNVTINDCPSSDFANTVEYTSVITNIKELLPSVRTIPNPADKSIWISGINGLNGSLSIVTLNGEVINQSEFQDDTEIDVSFLTNGLYLIQLATEHGNFQKKLVIRR